MSTLLMGAFFLASTSMFVSCKDYDDDINDVRNSITTTDGNLRALVNSEIATVNQTISTINTKISDLTTAYQAADAALANQIATLATKVELNAALAEAKGYTDTKAATAEQNAKEYAQLQAAAAQAAAISAAQQALEDAKKELQTALNAANEKLASQETSIQQLIEADKTLQTAITAAQARADQAYALATQANTLAETNKANIATNAAAIDGLKTSVAQLQTAQSALADKETVAKLQEQLTAVSNSLTATGNDLAATKETLQGVVTDLSNLSVQLANAQSTLDAKIADVLAKATGNEQKITSLTTELNSLKSANDLAIQDINSRISTLNGQVADNKAAAEDALSKAVAAINETLATKADKSALEAATAALATLQTTVEKNNTDINALLNTKVGELDGKIKENNTAIVALQTALGTETAASLKEYAEKVAAKALADAKEDATAKDATLLETIKGYNYQSKAAVDAAIDAATQTLIKTYELATLKNELLQAINDAKGAAAVDATTKANKALEDAKHYTDDAKTAIENTLKSYTDTEGMEAAIAAAKNSAIAQAYKDVLDALLSDDINWTQDSKVTTIAAAAAKAAKEYVDAQGLNDVQGMIDETIDEAMKASVKEDIGVEAKPAGKIMAAIEAAAKAAADDLTTYAGTNDARVKLIEDWYGAKFDDSEGFQADVNALIATAIDAENLEQYVKAVDYAADLTDIAGEIAQLDENHKTLKQDVVNIQNFVAGINQLFVNAAAENANAEDAEEADADNDDDDDDNVVIVEEDEPVFNEDTWQTFKDNLESLFQKVDDAKAVTDDLDNKVMASVNKNLGKNIQTMITSINLFANQHMAERDEQYKLGYWNGEEYIYPFGFENFDHYLTFCYTIEHGINSDYCEGTIAQEQWNYPQGLIEQLKKIKSDRDDLSADYDYSYDENGFSGSGDYDFVEGRFRTYEDSILVRVSPTNADLAQAQIALLNSQGEDIIEEGLVELVAVNKYEREAGKYITRPIQDGYTTRATGSNETGLWVIKFKLVDENIYDLYEKYAHSDGGDILYAVAVKNTNFSDQVDEEAEETADDGIDRYVVSEYDLSLQQEEAQHALDFTANGVDINKIHNRYITPEEGPNGYTTWTDDPYNYNSSFRYELTWHPLNCPNSSTEPTEPSSDTDEETIKTWYAYCWDCCYFDNGEEKDCDESEVEAANKIGYTGIIFQGDMDNYTDVEQEGVNTCDRHGHTIQGGTRNTDGVDNRHSQDMLPIEFDYDMDGAKWAKIEIEFPSYNECGKRTPIRGFFVTLDQHFGLESNNSEINAWAHYVYKNVAKYSYNHGVKDTDEDDLEEDAITLQPGNKGVIYIKDARNINNGDVIGFRVHAVNLDGTLTDPDGRAFYVKIGKEDITHQLSFHVTVTENADSSFAVQDPVNGANPIAHYNDSLRKAKSSDRFFNRPEYSSSFQDSELYQIVYYWRDGNPAIRGYETTGKAQIRAWVPQGGTGLNWADGNYDETANAHIKAMDSGNEITSKNYNVEKFFDFWYSENAEADSYGAPWFAENDEDDYNEWRQFTETNDDEETVYTGVPNKNTLSMRASINPDVANRLIDGETYKITMLILRRDNPTSVWQTVNSYDIDITKVMPTAMPEAFSVKTEQLTDGKWKFYVRPYGTSNEDISNTGEAWKIASAWANYGIKWINGASDKSAAFAKNFDGDINLNGDAAAALETSLQNYRWAQDARPYNFEEIFNGLFIADPDDADKTIVDKDYYFVFAQSGNMAATENTEGLTTTDNLKTLAAVADDAHKDDATVVVYDSDYNEGDVNDGADLDHSRGAYYLSPIHWSHVGDGDHAVQAGYIYRDISANLDETGKWFLRPTADDESNPGFEMTYDDYKLEPVDIPVGTTTLVANYNCAFFDAGVNFIDRSRGLWGTYATSDKKTFNYGWKFFDRMANAEGTDWEYTFDAYPGSLERQYEYEDDITLGSQDSVFFYIADKKFDRTRDVEVAYFDLQYPNADDWKFVDWTWDYTNNKTISDYIKGQNLDAVKDNYDPGQFARCLTLAEMLDNVWIDLSSLKVSSPSVSGFKFEDYYKAPYWTANDAEVKYLEENWSYSTNIANVTGIKMERKARTTLNPALNTPVDAYFMFDVYDMWFHKKTVKIPFRVEKPTNATGARRK